MPAPLISHDVRQACIHLFGRNAADHPTFLFDLSDTELKHHYRQQVKACHPDRALQLGRKESQLVIEFRRIDRSYKCLKAFLQRRGAAGGRRASAMFAGRRRASRAAERSAPQDTPRGGPRPGPKARQQQRRRSTMAGQAGDPLRNPNQQQRRQSGMGAQHEPFRSRAHQDGATQHRPPPPRGPGQRHIPERRLLLAEYLYHRGLITREQLIEALVWQRRQRPMIGQLAVDWGYLTQVDVKHILEQKQLGERFGEAARRLGYLSIFQHFALLGKQKGMQQRIGEFFIQRRILDATQIDAMVVALQDHNRSTLFKNWQ